MANPLDASTDDDRRLPALHGDHPRVGKIADRTDASYAHAGMHRDRSHGAPPPCIVCGAPAAVFFETADQRDYYSCRPCRAVFLHPGQRLSPDESYARYCQHRNDPGDVRYRRFLAKVCDPLLNLLRPGQNGLDYGCGPGPALACMLREAGHRVALFDLYFFPDRHVLEDTYDFITCTETAEHFHRPAREFARMDRMLRPGGWLALMTRFLTDGDHFASWYYRRDPTHVVFYRQATLRQVARHFGWHCTFPVRDVALMQKPLDRHPNRKATDRA